MSKSCSRQSFTVCEHLTHRVVLLVIVREYSVPPWHMLIGHFLKTKGFSADPDWISLILVTVYLGSERRRSSGFLCVN